jgi:hypothetical protein
VAESDPIRENRLICPNLNPIWSDFLKKSNWSDPIRTRPDPTQSEIKWLSIQSKSINDLKKIQYVNWPDPNSTQLDLISSKRSNWPNWPNPNPVQPEPDPIRPIATSKLLSPWFILFFVYNFIQEWCRKAPGLLFYLFFS